MLTILRDRRSYTVNIPGHPPPKKIKIVRAHNTTCFYFLVILHVTQSVLVTTSEEIHACKHESSAWMQLNKMFTSTLVSHKWLSKRVGKLKNLCHGDGRIRGDQLMVLCTARWRMVWPKCDEVNQIMEKMLGGERNAGQLEGNGGFQHPQIVKHTFSIKGSINKT